MSKSQNAENQGIDRRRTRRRPIIETFSMFCVVPKKGPYRLAIHDVSDQGIGFDLDMDGEDTQAFALKLGEQLEVHLYLNQSLYLPLSVKVARIEVRNGQDSAQGKVRRIGAELDSKDPVHAGFAAFLKMLDAIADVAKFA